MRFRHLTAALAAASLVATPTLAAAANPAASLSVAKSVRAGTPAAKSSKMVSGSATYALIGFLVVVAGFVALKLTTEDDSDSN